MSRSVRRPTPRRGSSCPPRPSGTAGGGAARVAPARAARARSASSRSWASASSAIHPTVQPAWAGFHSLDDHRGGPPLELTDDCVATSLEMLGRLTSTEAVTMLPAADARLVADVLQGVVAVELVDGAPATVSLVWDSSRRHPLLGELIASLTALRARRARPRAPRRRRADPRREARPAGAAPARRPGILGGLQEADPLGAVVHRQDPARPQLPTIARPLGADRGAAADGQEQEVDVAHRRALPARSSPWPKSPKWRRARRRGRTRRSCSGRARCPRRVVLGGDRRAPRRAATRGARRSSAAPSGSPPTASTPLWSRCSWVTSSRSALDALDRRIVEADPARRGHADMSPKGSIAPIAAVGRERNADWPYHSTSCCSSRWCRERRGRRWPRAVGGVGCRRPRSVVDARRASATPRRRSGRRRCESERLVQAVRNGAEIRCGKNERPVSTAWLCALSVASTWRPSRCWIGL